MDRRRTGRKGGRDVSPPSSRTRSKSPARFEPSGRDSAAIKRGRPKKTDSEEISSSSQSSTPKKLNAGKKEKQVIILDDSGDNDEVATINSRTTRLSTLRKRASPVNYKNTPTPSEDQKRSVSRTASSLTKEDSDEDSDEASNDYKSLGIHSKPFVNLILLIILAVLPILLSISSRVGWRYSAIFAELKRCENFYNLQSFSFVVAIHSASALISLLPIGKIVKLPDSEKEYKFNGILSAIIVVGFLFALEFKNLDSFAAIYNNIDRLLFLNIVKGLFVSTAVFNLANYRPSSEANAYGRSKQFLTDFTAGREINPKLFGRLDLKRTLYVQSVIYLLIVNIALIYKNVTIPEIDATGEASPINELVKQTWANFIFIVKNSEYNVAGFVVSGLIILYAIDLLIYEHHLATSFQINNEGFGAEVVLRFGVFPFLISFLPRYLFKYNIIVNNYVLAFASVIFLIGLIIKRGSNCLKHQYRLRPSDAKFKDLATLPTFRNRRLIIAKWWSKIRQPNLFGEILLHLALLNLLAPSFNFTSFFGIFVIIAYLIYRSIGINRKNAIKYESAWQRYLSAVKYNLLPRVY